MKEIPLLRLISVLASLFLIFAGAAAFYLNWQMASPSLKHSDKEKIYQWLAVHPSPYLADAWKAVDGLQDAVQTLTISMICAGVLNLAYGIWGKQRISN